jgi:formamidopyrimidine-DNA glycosylase
MPELPEVEVLARALRAGGLGREAVLDRPIARVEVPSDHVVKEPARRALQRRLRGRHVFGVARRGKTLQLLLDDGRELLIHLRMTGDVLTGGRSKQDRLRLRFVDGGVLRLEDPRHLAEVRLVDDGAAHFAALGPDALDYSLTGAKLLERLGASDRSVKAALLDQRTVAGVGNIWADEALFRAKLHPSTPTRALGAREGTALLRSLRSVLRGAIEDAWQRGVDWIYRGARDVEPPGVVHAREGQPCPRDRTPIVKTRVAGRGTYVCPSCQPAPTTPTTEPGRRRSRAGHPRPARR